MAAQGPESFFEELKSRLPEIISGLNSFTSSCGYPVYASLDVRDAGWKMAAVDVNLFPAGFNNLSAADRMRAALRMREFFAAKLLKSAPYRITVVPEGHTNNLGYLENLAGILGILKDADVEAKLMWPGDPIPKPWKIKTPSGQELEYLPAEQALEGAQAVLLNHDLSGGVPKAIQDLSLPIFPNPSLGWYRRRKSKHFEITEALLAKIERRWPFFDPWYFSMRSATIPEVDFASDAGLDRIAVEVEGLLGRLEKDYAARGIQETPRIFIKNDAGTYGMGVVSVASASEVRDGGRWLRTKMRKGKDSVAISQVILQEAIPTALSYEKTPGDPKTTVVGEPALYLVNGLAVGGFFRIHEGLGEDARWGNMNQPGSILEPLDCERLSPRPFVKPRGDRPCDQIGSQGFYGFLAKLHATAAGLEECPP